MPLNFRCEEKICFFKLSVVWLFALQQTSIYSHQGRKWEPKQKKIKRKGSKNKRQASKKIFAFPSAFTWCKWASKISENFSQCITQIRTIYFGKERWHLADAKAILVTHGLQVFLCFQWCNSHRIRQISEKINVVFAFALARCEWPFRIRTIKILIM